MNSFIRSWYKELAVAFIVLVAVFFSITLVMSSLRLNFFQMEFHLRALEMQDADQNNTFLVNRFQRQYQFYQKIKSQAESDRAEFQANLFLVDTTAERTMPPYLQSMDQWNLKAQNYLRTFLGNKPIHPIVNTPASQQLEKAYALEQRQQYAQAIDLYESISAEPALQGVVWLHQGFCWAVLGDFRRAQHYLQQVVMNDRASSIGVTAAILQSYLDLFLKEKQALLASQLPSIEKQIRLATLMPCSQNPDSLETWASENPTYADQLYYRLGRCQESTGHKEAAVQSYIKVLNHSKNKALQSDANRRIFLSGHTLLNSGQGMRALAVELNHVLQDSVLFDMQQLYQNVYAEDTLLSPKQDSILDLAPSLSLKLKKQKIPSRGSGTASRTMERNTPPIVLEQPVEDEWIPPELPPVFPIGTKVRLVTIHGKTHVGVLETSSDASMVQLKSSYWVMGIQQNEIQSITKAP